MEAAQDNKASAPSAPTPVAKPRSKLSRIVWGIVGLAAIALGTAIPSKKAANGLMRLNLIIAKLLKGFVVPQNADTSARPITNRIILDPRRVQCQWASDPLILASR